MHDAILSAVARDGEHLLEPEINALSRHGERTFRAAAAALASERGRLLSAVSAAVNELLVLATVSADAPALECDAPAVRDLCNALETALEHHLLPPMFSLSGATFWYALVQLQQSRSGRWLGGASGDDSGADGRRPWRWP